MNIKERFPDEVAIKNYLLTNIQTLMGAVKSEVGPLEAEYIEKSRLRNKGAKLMGLATVLVIVGIVPLDADFPTPGGVMLILLLLCFPVAGYLYWIGWRYMKGTSAAIVAFHNSLNDALYPLVFGMFGLSAQRVHHTVKDKSQYDTTYRKDGESLFQSDLRLAALAKELVGSPERDSVMALLDHSELITESRNTVQIDDMVASSINERIMFLSELDVKHVTGSGKNRRVKKIFHGYFVSFDLPRTLEGKTFVSTEGDKKGFGHQSFFKTKKNEGLEKTVLEWNEFENLLHVVTNNPTEARYILTPNFMVDLHNWWSEQKTNIRISFVDNRMYLLFPDKNIRLGSTIKKIETHELQEYLESISIPLLHVLHLIEDVEPQFS